MHGPPHGSNPRKHHDTHSCVTKPVFESYASITHFNMELNTRTEAAIADPTDDGTLRPNLPPTTVAGSHYSPMKTQKFNSRITLPEDIDNSPYAIWRMVCNSKMIGLFCTATNKYGMERRKREVEGCDRERC